MHEAPVDAALPAARAAGDGSRAAYWASVLPRLTGELSLPTDRVRTPDAPAERTPHPVEVPAGLPDDVLIAAWVTTLARLSGQFELTVGLPVAGPADGGGGDLVPVPVALDPTSSYDVVFPAITALHAEAAAHAPAPSTADALFRVGVARSRAADGAAAADLVLVLDGPASAIEHTDIFDPASVADLADQWLRTAQAATADPAVAVDAVDLTSDDARDRVRAWGTGPVDVIPGWTMPGEFARRRHEAPDRPAVVSAATTLSYDDLAGRAFRIANVLRDLGAGRGTRVAVCLDRTTDTLASLLAVLATGAAYVPVDPAYPADRVDYMLTDAEVIAVVTTSDLATELPATTAHVLTLDTEPWVEAVATAPATAPADGPRHEDTAYVIYTSGSTGKPKGVMVPHGALTNFLESVRREPGMAAGDTLLAVTTVSFDIAGLEFYLPLVAGGTVVLATQDETRDPAALVSLLTAHDIDIMQATPATWRMLIDWGWEGKPDLLVLCGGEALPPSLADGLIPRCGQLWNMYGPTETTIWSSLCHLSAPGELPTLGHGFLNTTLHVVDERLREVPIGVAGELLIGGAGLAQGYRGRDDLTAEKFLASPFPDLPEAGDRVYRTGDLVRWRRDGRLEFLGRIDNQVKVRGFRIELGEIETVLDGHPEVAEAVVVVREDTGGDKTLVGYVVRQPDSTVSPGDLRRHVGASLPVYMVPAAVVVLGTFPRTPNGKTDRKALPAPDPSALLRNDIVAPRDELEAQLVAVWEEVLRISPIGVTDNFFDLGVNSLTAARLFARVERDFGHGLPLGAVFRSPTIAGLAGVLRGGPAAAAAAGSKWRSLVPLQPNGSQPPIFGVHGGAGTILLYHELSRRLGTDQPFYGLQAAGLYGDIAPDITVADMAERYIAEIADVQPQGPYTLLGYCFGALVAYEMADRLQQRGHEVALVGAINGPAPSYLTTYRPLFDDEGEVERPAPVDMSLRARLERQTAGRRTRPQQAKALVRAVSRRVRRGTRRRWREAQYAYVLRARRRLPDWMREGAYVQRIAEEAQNAWEPRRLPLPVAVFSADGLYASPDLGWTDLSTGVVQCISVPGDGQTTPRRSMREPYVETIADGLRAALGNRAPASSDRGITAE